MTRLELHRDHVHFVINWKKDPKCRCCPGTVLEPYDPIFYAEDLAMCSLCLSREGFGENGYLGFLEESDIKQINEVTKKNKINHLKDRISKLRNGEDISFI